MSLKAAFEKQRHSLLPWSGLVNLVVVATFFVVVTVAQFSTTNPATGFGFLYVIPILLLAMQHGARGALAGTGIAFGLFMAWNLSGEQDVGMAGSFIRLVALAGTAALVVAIDASQVRTRAKFSETDALLRAISDNMPDALYVIDEDGRYGLVNAAAAALVGKQPEDLLGERYVDLLPRETAADLNTLKPGAEERPDAIGRVDRVSFPDGSRVFRSVTGPVCVEESGRQGIFVMSQDITPEYRRETYHRIQQRVAERLVEGPPIGQLPAIVLDHLAEVDEIGWGAYWHREQDGTYRCLTVAGEDIEVAVGDRRVDFQMPTGFQVAWRERRGDRGGPTALVPVGPDGVAMIAYTGDVPDPETIDRIFKPTILMLDGYVERTRLRKETERTQNEFFGMISHELRTPLTSIIGYADLLAELERDSMSERAQQFVEVISRNAHRELRLVQDLLLLVRLEAGTFTLERDVGDLRAIVEQSCEAVRPQAGRGDIGLDVSLTDTGEIWGDAHRLGQAVDNLLTNAVKFSEPGDVVHVRLEADGEHASIEVEDEGIGVAEEEVDKLFDRLFRASSAVSNQIQGTGLGLTIVKSVIEAHGGKVSVRSRSGEGTCFRIELPLTRPPQLSAPEPVSGSAAGNGNGGANGNGSPNGIGTRHGERVA